MLVFGRYANPDATRMGTLHEPETEPETNVNALHKCDSNIHIIVQLLAEVRSGVFLTSRPENGFG
jgi:hypothetical protein